VANAFAAVAMKRALDCARRSNATCDARVHRDLKKMRFGARRAGLVSFPCVPTFNTCTYHEWMSSYGGPYQCCGGACTLNIAFYDDIQFDAKTYFVKTVNNFQDNGWGQGFLYCQGDPTPTIPSITVHDNHTFDNIEYGISFGIGSIGFGAPTQGHHTFRECADAGFCQDDFYVNASGESMHKVTHKTTVLVSGVWGKESHDISYTKSL
jgi:hypothetical protein